MARKSGLGKGLDILIPQGVMKNDDSEKKTEKERIQKALDYPYLRRLQNERNELFHFHERPQEIRCNS